MDCPTVSVVMAVRNAERFLAEAIQSILDQSYEDFEFIIVDYGSKDGSKTIVRDYAARDNRIKVHEISDCVLPEARNAGCFHARGRYIAVMDGDDISLPDRLSREVDYMESHPHVALLGAAVEWINSDGRSFHIHRHPTDYSEIQKKHLIGGAFWHPTMIMRKEAFVSVGGYRRVMVCAHDYDLTARIAEKFECANLNEIVLKYRFHSSQLSADKQLQQTLCKLATQVSAAARRKGLQDPLDETREITPSTLSALGVGELAQRTALVADARRWTLNMVDAGEYAAAAVVAQRILESDSAGVDPREVSDLYLTLAFIRWKEKIIWKSMLALRQAVRVRPAIIGRPLKRLVQKLGLA
jgi:hypothetical protein